MKHCVKCEAQKPLSDFYVNKASGDGRLAHCKACHTEYIRKRRAEDPVEFLLAGCRTRAKKEKVPCTITSADLPRPTHCPVLGIKLNYKGTGRGYGAKEDAASVDRVISRKGYVPGNVNIVSWKANRAKAFLTPAELQRMAAFYAKYLL